MILDEQIEEFDGQGYSVFKALGIVVFPVEIPFSDEFLAFNEQGFVFFEEEGNIVEVVIVSPVASRDIGNEGEAVEEEIG